MASFTRKAIMDSCLRLLEERPVDKITVKDIVEDCGINRNTFYYHFEDLPSLINAIFMEDAEKTIQESFVINSLWECFDSVINFALKRRRVVMHVYHSSHWAVYEQQMFMICGHAVTQYVEKLLGDMGDLQVQENDKRIIIQAYTCECYGQIISWLNSSMKEDFLQDMIRLCRLREGEVRELLLRSTRI
ncbi:MAG: TetR/AcrR family transcriptional regulator [Candidatus Ventricola sp.]